MFGWKGTVVNRILNYLLTFSRIFSKENMTAHRDIAVVVFTFYSDFNFPQFVFGCSSISSVENISKIPKFF